MPYQIAPLFCRPWTLLAITPKLIESHYENNYGGACARLNAISEELEALDPATTPAHVIRRLKQDEAAALNSLALHELYFASLGADGRAIPEVMANALARDFGSVDRWRAEFVALAKSKPGELNFGSPGSSTLNRLEMEHFMKLANLKIVHIPYKGGAGPAVIGLLGGETQVMFVTLSSAISFIQAGKLKALGISTAKRIDALPQVPTMAEAGYPEMISSSWQGVFVPAGTPRPIVEKLHAALLATLDSPEIRQRFAGGGVNVVTNKTPEDFVSFVGAETMRWGKVAKESGATID